jgi:RNA polymerase sigma factor, sigma-70 family
MDGINFDELYYLIGEKNEDAEHAMIKEVESYLKWLCSQKSNHFLREEDIMSYGWQGYIEALISYNPENNTSFRTFLYYCISRRLLDIQRRRNKQSLKGHMTGISMSESIVKYTVESRADIREISDAGMLFQTYWEKLPEETRTIFSYFLQGKTAEEIAEAVDKKSSTIYLRIRKIREELKKLLLEKDD